MEKSNTQAVSIPASPSQVFDFIANPETLPLWAVGFCRGIRREGADWIVTTPRAGVQRCSKGRSHASTTSITSSANCRPRIIR